MSNNNEGFEKILSYRNKHSKNKEYTPIINYAII